jgi:tetratricopeptide (TPR) repeat protein
MNSYPGGYNDDVLLAEIPATSDAKLKLVEELKFRAKGVIASRNFPEAVKLYSKALDAAEGESAAAILFANRSMCYLNMSLSSQALEDANSAIGKDALYLKSYYRKAMSLIALGRKVKKPAPLTSLLHCTVYSLSSSHSHCIAHPHHLPSALHCFLNALLLTHRIALLNVSHPHHLQF